MLKLLRAKLHGLGVRRVFFSILTPLIIIIGSINLPPIGKVLASISRKQIAEAPMSSSFRADISDGELTWDDLIKTTYAIYGETNSNCKFGFVNIWSGDVKIVHIQPSCGCTTAKHPPLPWVIHPGSTGQIEVNVNHAGKVGIRVHAKIDAEYKAQSNQIEGWVLATAA